MSKTGLKIALVLAALIAPATVLAQGAMHSVWEGAYTAEQAARGKMQYGDHCAKCHGPALGGNEMAPALAGAAFLDNWNAIPVGDLVERIRTTMPADNPGSLSRRTVTDIVTYILQANQIPVGAAEMPGDAQIQAMFLLDASKPAGLVVH